MPTVSDCLNGTATVSHRPNRASGVQGLVFIMTTAYPAIMWYYDRLKTFFKKQARANGIETIEMD